MLHPWQLVARGETSGSALVSCQPRWIRRAKEADEDRDPPRDAAWPGESGVLLLRARRLPARRPGRLCARGLCGAHGGDLVEPRAARAQRRAPAQRDLPGEVGDRRAVVAFTAGVGAEVQEVVPAAELILVVVRR